MSTITNSDYIKILEYYNIKIPTSKRLLQKRAENIMANKLCKCIKKIDPVNEAKSIGICTKSVINRKGFVCGKFQCKKKRFVTLRKMRVRTKRRFS